MHAERKRPLWLWMTAIILALPFLYVLSSGPMISVVWRRHVYHETHQNGRVTARTVYDPGIFWATLYAPLVWASDHSWGDSLSLYWDQFPVRPARP